MLHASLSGGGRFDRVDNVLISGAAAEIALQAVANLLVGRVGVPRQNLFGAEDHAGCTETALKTVLVPERFLHGVEFAVGGGQALDGGQVPAVGLHGEHGAGFYGLVAQQYGASAADGGFAADVRTGKAGDIAQVVDEKEPGLYFIAMWFSINGERDRAFHVRIPESNEDFTQTDCNVPKSEAKAKAASCRYARGARRSCETKPMESAIVRKSFKINEDGYLNLVWSKNGTSLYSATHFDDVLSKEMRKSMIGKVGTGAILPSQLLMVRMLSTQKGRVVLVREKGSEDL
jgi:hypothetical protein